MRPKRDAAGLSGISNRTRCPTKKLIYKPETQHHPRRQVKETQPKPGEQSRPWIENEIGPQYASNRAAGAHVGHTRKRVQDDLRQRGQKSANQVERQILKMSQVIFDV